jgi:hypothetical protein
MENPKTNNYKMKTLFIKFIFICFVFNSCSMQKRLYSNGYNINWNINMFSEQETETNNVKIKSKQVQNIFEDSVTTFCSSNKFDEIFEQDKTSRILTENRIENELNDIKKTTIPNDTNRLKRNLNESKLEKRKHKEKTEDQKRTTAIAIVVIGLFAMFGSIVFLLIKYTKQTLIFLGIYIVVMFIIFRIIDLIDYIKERKAKKKKDLKSKMDNK